MRLVTTRTHPSASLRWMAGLLAALVLAAVAGAVSPAVHSWLHGHSASACAHDDDCGTAPDEHAVSCAAVLLAGASDASNPFVPVPAPTLRLLTDVGAYGESVLVPAPRHLHRPGRAPPPSGTRQA
jgi:hypothetical protein